MHKPLPPEPFDKLRLADEQLAAIEATGMLGSWLWDFAQGELSWSKGFYRLVGLDPASVRPSISVWQDLLHPDDLRDLSDPASLFSHESTGERTVRIVRPDGGLRYIRSLSEVVYGRSGRPRAVRGVSFDVSETERLKRERRVTEETARLTLDLSKARAWSYLPATDAPVPPERALLWAPPSARRAIRESWARAAAGAGSFTVDFLSDEGTLIVARGMPLRDERGDVIAWVGVVHPADDVPVGSFVVPPWAIRAARAGLGWTVKHLASEAGISLSTVRRAEEPEGNFGVRQASSDLVVAALTRVGVSFRYVGGQLFISVTTRAGEEEKHRVFPCVANGRGSARP